MNNCIYCGAPLDDDSQFCANCGKRIKLCPKCGSVLKGDSLFCAKCGTRLDMRTSPIGPQQIATNTTTLKVDENVADDVVEEEKRNWVYLISGCAIIALLILSWVGYTQFYKYTHIDVHELLEELQLPKEYYHSAKEIVNNHDFDLKQYQEGRKYELRGWIVYNQKYSNEIRFINKSFNKDDESIKDFYWVIGHILDCWNTTPAEAVFEEDHDGAIWVTDESTFYYTSTKSRGIQFVVIEYDQVGNPKFQSVDGKYEANFKQVHL